MPTYLSARGVTCNMLSAWANLSLENAWVYKHQTVGVWCLQFTVGCREDKLQLLYPFCTLAYFVKRTAPFWCTEQFAREIPVTVRGCKSASLKPVWGMVSHLCWPCSVRWVSRIYTQQHNCPCPVNSYEPTSWISWVLSQLVHDRVIFMSVILHLTPLVFVLCWRPIECGPRGTDCVYTLKIGPGVNRYSFAGTGHLWPSTCKQLWLRRGNRWTVTTDCCSGWVQWAKVGLCWAVLFRFYPLYQ